MSIIKFAQRQLSRVMDDAAISADALGDWLRGTKERTRGKHFQICHTMHEHDRTYAENVCEYFEQVGLECRVVEFQAPGRWTQLRQCLDESTIGVLGFNAQLDQCLVGSRSFLAAAALRRVPVIHWILDHPSTRWHEFTHANAVNSRFLFASEFAARYFRRYCLPDARTAWTASVGPNWRSRIAELSAKQFLSREIACLVPLSLRTMRQTITSVEDRLRSMDRRFVEPVEQAIERARSDLAGPLEAHLEATFAMGDYELSKREFNHYFQIVQDTVQLRRRLKIFEIASRFPVRVQTDSVPETISHISVARFSTDTQANSMTATANRMKSCRAVLSANYANDLLHDRTENGLNAGCVVIVEDTPMHRRLFSHGANALLFRYDDDSLAECLDLVCKLPERAYEIAHAGFALRDRPAIRFGGFENILGLSG